MTEIHCKSYVAFLDILGFSELSKAADNDKEILAIIENIVFFLKNNPAESELCRITQFSDCVVLSGPYNLGGLHSIFINTIRLALELLPSCILLRGGIAVGMLTHKEQAIYGSGLVRAYNLDNKGGPPRIRLSKDVLESLKELGIEELSKGYIRKDEYDAEMMLDVLGFARLFRPDMGFMDFDKIAEHISLRATPKFHSNSGVRAKWRWLRQYWNTCEDLPKAI